MAAAGWVKIISTISQGMDKFSQRIDATKKLYIELLELSEKEDPKDKLMKITDPALFKNYQDKKDALNEHVDIWSELHEKLDAC